MKSVRKLILGVILPSTAARSISGVVLTMVVAVPGVGAENPEPDVETTFMNTLLAISPRHEAVMNAMAAAYTVKCGQPPTVDQMKTIGQEDASFAKAVAMHAVRDNQLKKEGVITLDSRFIFAEYMQAVSEVICR